jgi:uncharacterized OB-fold protein
MSHFIPDSIERPVWAIPGSIAYAPDGSPQVMAGVCRHCGQSVFPPPKVCPACWEETIDNIEVPSTGTVYTYSVVHSGRAGWKTPYVLAFVDFKERNVRVAGIVQGPEGWRPELDSTVRVGTGIVCIDANGEPVYAHCFLPE